MSSLDSSKYITTKRLVNYRMGTPLLEGGRLVSGIRTEKGIPRSRIDRWRRAGLPAATLHLAEVGDADPIPVRLAN